MYIWFLYCILRRQVNEWQGMVFPFSPHFNYDEIGSRTENFEMMGDIKRMRFSWKWLTIEILY